MLLQEGLEARRVQCRDQAGGPIEDVLFFGGGAWSDFRMLVHQLWVGSELLSELSDARGQFEGGRWRFLAEDVDEAVNDEGVIDAGPGAEGVCGAEDGGGPFAALGDVEGLVVEEEEGCLIAWDAEGRCWIGAREDGCGSGECHVHCEQLASSVAVTRLGESYTLRGRPRGI